MCLTINRAIHALTKYGEFKAFTAKTDIAVDKLLEENGAVIDGLSTPYQYLPIKFRKGRVTLEARGFASVTTAAEVAIGIHAFCSRKATEHELDYARSYGWVFKKFFAVIPAGSKFFVGREIDGDIVSNKLIIFESEDAYEEYCENHEVERFSKENYATPKSTFRKMK